VGGSIDSVETSITSQLKDLDNREVQVNERVALRQTALEAKFAAMEATLAKLQTTTNSLTQTISQQNKSSGSINARGGRAASNAQEDDLRGSSSSFAKRMGWGQPRVRSGPAAGMPSYETLRYSPDVTIWSPKPRQSEIASVAPMNRYPPTRSALANRL
jgi:hypothetical protein